MGRTGRRGTIGIQTIRMNKGRATTIQTRTTTHSRYGGRFSSRIGPLALIVAVIILAGCGGHGTKVIETPQHVAVLPPIPTPTEFPMGSGQPAPLRDSLALIRQAGTDSVSGAALVITSDGFLVTIDSNLGKKPEIVLPNGEVASPIRVANDSTTGITLLKVSASRLVPVELGLEQIEPHDRIFAAGFDQTTASYGQVAGVAITSGNATPTDDPSLIQTNIGFAQGFNGGALSDGSGQLVGLVVNGHNDNDKNVISAIPIRYVTDWISRWRDANQSVASQSSTWSVITAVDSLTLRYPDGWSVASEHKSGSSYSADISPNDRDVPAKLSISVQSTDFKGDPMSYAHEQFDNKSNATIWGAVEYGQIPGVRVLVNQEGARVDVVYLFDHGLRIGVSLSAGYPVDDTGAQEQRLTALFEAVLRSVAFSSATPAG